MTMNFSSIDLSKAIEYFAQCLAHEVCAGQGRPPMADFLTGCQEIADAVRDAGDGIAAALREGHQQAGGLTAAVKDLTESLDSDPRRDI